MTTQWDIAQMIEEGLALGMDHDRQEFYKTNFKTNYKPPSLY